jgi:hypothetical protein
VREFQKPEGELIKLRRLAHLAMTLTYMEHWSIIMQFQPDEQAASCRLFEDGLHFGV